jgi:hypothetical protein
VSSGETEQKQVNLIINIANFGFPLFSKNLATWLIPYIAKMFVHRSAMLLNKTIRPITATVTGGSVGGFQSSSKLLGQTPV